MGLINNYSNVSSDIILEVANNYGTPCYLYDEEVILRKCDVMLSMPHAFGLKVRYAMKANSTRKLLSIISQRGLDIDASSLNEVRRAIVAGISPNRVILTSQETYDDDDFADLKLFINEGLTYNVCSLRQLYKISDFAKASDRRLSIRIHPGVGSGESLTRNTGDDYSCFGVHKTDLQIALDYAKERGIIFGQVHVHIGSGSNPQVWMENVDLVLDIVEKHFHEVTTVSLGGGFKEARMPNEIAADIELMGLYAKTSFERFNERTGRKLVMEVEPGTFIIANSGYAITRVIDKKQTGSTGSRFIIVDGGMDINTRPLLYGSQHPFYVVSKSGTLLYSEYDGESIQNANEYIVVGTCCESGDSLSIDIHGNNIPRKMNEPDVGDLVIVGGTGAYCSSMTLSNYNSHTQIPEVLAKLDGTLLLIRQRQSLDQIIQNEL